MLIPLLAALLLQASPLEATLDVVDVSALAHDVHEEFDVPALWIGRVDLNGLTAAGVSGVRERGSQDVATFGDRLHLGSCTKSMTAALVGIYAERGVLSFDDSIATRLGGLVETVDDGWSDVTLAHLLAHRGGAPPNLARYGLLQFGLNKHKGEPSTHRISHARGVLKRAPVDPVGEKFVYSNHGYMLVGSALEQATGKAWRTLMAEDLYGPLGITTFGFGAPDELDNQPVGHTAKGKPAPRLDNAPVLGPAGRAHLPLAEWAKFIAWHLRGADGDTPLLSQAGFGPLHTPSLDPKYAGGWIVTKRGWSAGPVLMHNGSNTVWMCVAWLAPAENVAYLAVVNQGGPLAARAVDAGVSALISADRQKAGAKDREAGQ